MPDNKKILLVEDEPLLLNLLKQRLERDGFEIVAAHDGEEALKILETVEPSLILLDIILPKVSGFEVMEAIQKNPNYKKAPIIVISNLGQDTDMAKGQSLGAVGYFIKAQVSIEDLVTKIKAFLSGQKTI
ncbi:MAG: response regulator [bacterium]|nr:response regulator [bacterium]